MRHNHLFASLPNFVSLARLALAPLAVLLIVQDAWRLALLVFIAAGVSDAIDGFLAKRFHLQSELGAYLDPAADKALLVSIYVTLAVTGVIPPALAILVVARDVMIVGGILIAALLDRRVAIRPLFVSKVNTAVQITAAAVILADKAFALGIDGPLKILLYAVAILTIASAAAYLGQWFNHLSPGRRPS